MSHKPNNPKDLQSVDLTDVVQRLLSRAQEQGYVTFDEINDVLPDGLDPLDLDELLTKMRALDVEIVDPEEATRAVKSLHRSGEIIRIDISDQLFRYFHKHPDQMYSLPPRKFEELVAAMLKELGYSVELTPPIKDGGFDIIAVQKNSVTGTTVNLVECKRYRPERKIAVGIVRSLLGVVESKRATKGLLITTSFFTRDAKQFAEQNTARLALDDFWKISGWLDQIVRRTAIKPVKDVPESPLTTKLWFPAFPPIK